MNSKYLKIIFLSFMNKYNLGKKFQNQGSYSCSNWFL